MNSTTTDWFDDDDVQSRSTTSDNEEQGSEVDDMDEYLIPALQDVGPNPLEERLAAAENKIAEQAAVIEKQGQELDDVKKLVMALMAINFKTEASKVNATGEVNIWWCDTYNSCYNMSYEKFVSNPEGSFTKEQLKNDWEATQPKNKSQINTTLNRMIEVGFIEEFGKRGSKSYKLSDNEKSNGIREREELFTAIGRDANTARNANLRPNN